MTRLFPVAAIVFALCASAYAQKQQAVTFPDGLKWEMMRFASFFPNDTMRESATTDEKKMGAEIWKKELDGLPVNKFIDKSKGEYNAELLIGTHETTTHKFTFSILSAPGWNYSACKDNGRGMPPVCSVRMVSTKKSNGKTKQWTYPNYCFIYSDYSEKAKYQEEENKNHPLSGNHTEIAVHNNTAYFRVIHNGEWVPACNRSLQLQLP